MAGVVAVVLGSIAYIGVYCGQQRAATPSGALQMNPRDTIQKPMDELKKRLYSLDQDTSGLALAEFIRRGKESTPILLEALTHDNPRTRRLAAEGLAEIKDRSAADALFKATSDPNDEVRGRAAGALNALGDSRALPALVKTIDDYPDILHSPYTASMYPLMRSGKQTLPLIVPLLTAPNEITRVRAFTVLRAIVSAMPEGKDWDALSNSLGRYDPAGPPAERDKAAEQWKAWVAKT